jgi:hypothetical protein
VSAAGHGARPNRGGTGSCTRTEETVAHFAGLVCWTWRTTGDALALEHPNAALGTLPYGDPFKMTVIRL